MFDDSQLLIRHIRSCFIQGDESGQCEQALDENVRHPHSPPIAMPDADDLKDAFGKIALNNPGSSTKVHYLTALAQLSMEDFYPEKESNLVESKPAGPTSLTDILTSHFSNPFHRYSRFSAQVKDGNGFQVAACPGVRTLSISIFLESRSPVECSPMILHVNVVNARIVDLIGLILWHYFAENLEPSLPDLEISHYALLSADEGDVDFGIPSFDPLEPLSKYGFSTMALVYVPNVLAAKDKSGRPAFASPRSARVLPTQLLVTLSHYSFGTHEFLIDSKDVTLAKLLDMYLNKVLDDPDLQYAVRGLDKTHFTLEADSQPGRFCENLENTPIGRAGCYSFKVHRKYCNPASDEKIDLGKTGPAASGRNSTESKTRGQVFHVSVERAKNKPVDIDLLVDTDIVHLNQKEPNTSKSTPKSIVRATIESCRLVGADVSAVPGTKQVVRIELTFKPTDRETKKLIMVLDEQRAAIELVSLLRR